MRRVSAWAKKMADREEGQKAFLANVLGCLTAPSADVERQRHFRNLARRRYAGLGTKNPGWRAGQTGVAIGTEESTEPKTFYRTMRGLS